jgi:hypothetical protein
MSNYTKKSENIVLYLVRTKNYQQNFNTRLDVQTNTNQKYCAVLHQNQKTI